MRLTLAGPTLKRCSNLFQTNLWQGSRLIAETDNDKHWQTYLYEPDSYRPLALVHGNAQQDNIKLYWYQNDHLGTPIALTSNMGDTLYECQYNAYGQIINETYHQDDSQSLPDNPLRFQGQYYDEETGLHYNLNRYYDPFTGRYITQDPLGILGGLNSYQYAGSDPINWIDPLGLVKVENSGFEHLELSDRHLLDRVSIPKATGNSIFTGTRTEALADLAEIKSGVAIRDGELFTTSSGRVWGIHNNSVHPVSGPGVVNISSLEYNILVQARKRGKDNALITLGHLEKNKKLSSEKIERVKILLNLMKDRK